MSCSDLSGKTGKMGSIRPVNKHAETNIMSRNAACLITWSQREKSFVELTHSHTTSSLDTGIFEGTEDVSKGLARPEGYDRGEAKEGDSNHLLLEAATLNGILHTREDAALSLLL